MSWRPRQSLYETLTRRRSRPLSVLPAQVAQSPPPELMRALSGIESGIQDIAARPVRRRRWPVAAALVVAISGVLALCWLAVETHYRSCVDRAEALAGRNLMIPGGGGNAEAQSGFLVITNAGRDAIERCSRWPL